MWRFLSYKIQQDGAEDDTKTWKKHSRWDPASVGGMDHVANLPLSPGEMGFYHPVWHPLIQCEHPEAVQVQGSSTFDSRVIYPLLFLTL